MKRVAVTGPESTGKSTLSEALALHFDCPLINEYAREYLEKLHRPYLYEDIEFIAIEQMRREDELIKNRPDLIVADTDLIVIKIWMEHRYGTVPDWLDHKINERKYDLYLLCNIDVNWEPDPLREHPLLRAYFFRKFLEELTFYQANFVIIERDYKSRLNSAYYEVNKLI